MLRGLEAMLQSSAMPCCVYPAIVHRPLPVGEANRPAQGFAGAVRGPYDDAEPGLPAAGPAPSVLFRRSNTWGL
jgi:hypothetical protein